MKSIITTSILLVQAALFSCLFMNVNAQSNMGTVIKEGVILDRRKGEIYFLNKDHQLEAISAKTGALVWQSNDQSKPVALVDRRLLATSEDTSQVNKVVLGVLDSRRKEKGLVKDTVTLPLQSDIGYAEEKVKLNFSPPRVVNGDVFIPWNYVRPIPMQGIHRKPDTAATAGNRPPPLAGTIKIAKNSNKPTVELKAAGPAAAQDRSVVLPSADRIQGVTGAQYLSSDKNNILVSQRAPDDTGSYNKYVWQIYDRKGKLLGQVSDYRSFAPFVVNGSVMLYEIGPYSERQGNQMREVPLKLVAVDLSAGRLLWSQEVYDNTNRKSTPP